MVDKNKKTLLAGKDNASLVIEGSVVKSDNYYNKSKTAMYSQYTIRVKKILKGTLSDSLIEMISYFDYGDEVMPLEMYGQPQKNLRTGYNAIFFGNPNKLELNESTNNNLTNYFDVYNQLKIDIQQESSNTIPVAQYKYLTFRSKNELYEAMGFFAKPPKQKCTGGKKHNKKTTK